MSSTSSACSLALIAVLAFTAASARAADAPPSAPALRVCADPNNLPFSNAAGEGFENALARLVAEDFGWRLEYFWWPQRRAFVRNTLGAHACDVVMGLPAGFERTATTRPYYRSTYVFVVRRDGPSIRSFDDDALRRASIGIHLIGDDYSNPPPELALARRGIVGNVHGYSIYGDYSRPNPPAALIDAVASGAIDVAVAWGPLAGYFARRARVPLVVTPVSPQIDVPFLPFVFDIAFGTRRDDPALRDRLDGFIVRRRADVRRVLAGYGVPLVDEGRQAR